MGTNIGLTDIQLWWQGYGGLTLFNAVYKLRTLDKVGDNPFAILLHCGGNDLGKVSLKRLRKVVVKTFNFVNEQLPGCYIIWSEVLPRASWRYSISCVAMERCRQRLNSFAGTLAIRNGGCFIKYPMLSAVSEKLYLDDGVHLSKHGNILFLNQIAKGITAFVKENNQFCS